MVLYQDPSCRMFRRQSLPGYVTQLEDELCKVQWSWLYLKITDDPSIMCSSTRFHIDIDLAGNVYLSIG